MSDGAQGPKRAAATLLHAHEDGSILLRMPQAAAAGDDGEQLGLATPVFHDVELMPAVLRRLGVASEVLVGAEAISALVGSLAFDSAELLFANAAGVVVADRLLRVSAVTALRVAGCTVAWRVSLAQ